MRAPLSRLRLFLQPPLAGGVRENIEQPAALSPADAGVGDAHAVHGFLAPPFLKAASFGIATVARLKYRVSFSTPTLW